MTVVHDRYPLGGLLGDYGRALGGLAVCLGLLLFVDGVTTVVILVLGVLSLCFAAFAIRTVIRHRSIVVVDGTGVRVDGPRPAAVTWCDLRQVGLRHFSPRPGVTRARLGQEADDMSKPRSGWMQLDLSGSGRTVRIDSTLASFPAILDRVAERMRDGDITANDVTRANLAALGLMTWTEAVDPAATADTPAGKEDLR